MKLLIIFVALIAATQADVANCITGTDAKAATAACAVPSANTKCLSPKVLANNTFVFHGCSEADCDDAANNKTCQSCNSADDCNAYVPPVFNYKCLKNNTAVECSPAVELSKIACFIAAKDYAGDNVDLKLGGCMSCDEQTHTNGTKKYAAAECTTCAFENCNSGAASMTVLLAPLLALAFWLH